MFRLVQLRRYYYMLSAAIIIPGIVLMLYSLVTTGSLFPLGIDFVGGSIYEIRFASPGASESSIRDVFETYGSGNVSIQQIGASEANRWSIRVRTSQDTETTTQITAALNEIAPLDMSSLRIESVSSTIGAEASRAAFVAVMVAAVVVTGFIVIAFRSVPYAFRYGMCAIAAMFHDVLIVCSAAMILGLLFKWEVDALFLTALLTVVGFSVQDTIVVFDRIRENIPKHLGEPYETIINRSSLETIHRSLATQLNAFFIMIAILLFGGDSIKQFITILFIGLLSGTYSSIFIAVPLLVSWEKGEIPFINRAAKARQIQMSES